MGQLREGANPCNISILIIVRLTYKYHRLVASSDRPGELPQVEKCVVDDDEEDEEEVREVALFSILWPRNSADYWKILDDFRTSSPWRFSEIFRSFLVFVGNLRKTSKNVWQSTKVFGWFSAWQLVTLYDVTPRSWWEFYLGLCSSRCWIDSIFSSHLGSFQGRQGPWKEDSQED